MEELRDAAREIMCINQQHNRESLLDKHRKLGNVENLKSATEEDVIKLANELKKRHTTPEHLSQLQDVLLHGNYVTTFLEVDGALEALVKALSGHNAKLQIGSAYCLCNLSLGEKYLKILKTAGPYLLLHVEGMNTHLIEACVWTLGNLSSHHKKCVKLLKSQGALPLLCRLLNHKDDKVITAGVYALSHLIYTGYEVLTTDDFRDLTEPVASLFKAKPALGAYLTTLLASNANCQLKLLQEGVHMEALKFLLCSLKEDILHSSWYIRVMGNLVPEETGRAALQLLQYQVPEGNETLYSAIEYIVRSGQIFLIKECCWLLGNLINHRNKEVSRLVDQSGIIEKIANPIRYLLLDKKNPGVEGPFKSITGIVDQKKLPIIMESRSKNNRQFS